MTGRLSGKRAFILGATTPGGIGAAIARRFVEEGARVVIGGRSPDKLGLVAKEVGAETVAADILDPASLKSGAEAAAAKLGGLDIAVNAVGVNRSALIAEETAEELMMQARIHFVG